VLFTAPMLLFDTSDFSKRFNREDRYCRRAAIGYDKPFLVFRGTLLDLVKVSAGQGDWHHIGDWFLTALLHWLFSTRNYIKDNSTA